LFVAGPAIGLGHLFVHQGGYLLLCLAQPVAYALVHTERRYLGSSLAAFWTIVYAGLPVRTDRESRPWVAGIVKAAAVFIGITLLPLTAYSLLPQHLHVDPDGQHRNHARVAAALSQFGVKPSDPVAVVGRGIKAYWARLAHVRIVAEVDDRDLGQFWGTPPAGQPLLLAALARSGAKVAVAWGAGGPGWTPVEGTEFSIRALRKPVLDSTP
jgi:hypothetical protein